MFGTKLNETKIFERHTICGMLKIHAWTFLAAGPCPLDLVLKLLKMLHVKRLTQVRSMYLRACIWLCALHLAKYRLPPKSDKYLPNIIRKRIGGL